MPGITATYRCKSEFVDRTELNMSGMDKAKNAAEGTLGKAKEAVGKTTDDESLEAEGRKEQASSDLKQAGEKVKDAFKS
jgi:uncharacterized protein YjbJ (UPF0337 family)